MKYFIIIPDGACDYPLKELDNLTPLQFSRTPNTDYLARNGIVGIVKTIPEGLPKGSDVAIFSLLGYDPKKYYTGRGPLEAASLGVKMKDNDVAFRCNLITSDGEIIIDYAAGHISTEEAYILMKKISEKLETDYLKFYPGISYRHLMLWKNGPEDIKCVPPHDIIGGKIKENLPKGEGERILKNLIYNSIEILDSHDINKKRRDEGKNPANMIWPWGAGKFPRIQTFMEKYGITGAVITAVDVVKGIGKLAGLEFIKVPGVTGYYDTNYKNKGEYAVGASSKFDLVVVHIEATDEAGHNADIEEKIKAIEMIDREIIGRIVKNINNFKIMVVSDHFTPVSLRTHTSEPVPFLIYSSDKHYNYKVEFDEISAKKSNFYFEEGEKLIEFFMKEKT